MNTLPKPLYFSVTGSPKTEGSTRAFIGKDGKARVTHVGGSELERWRTGVRVASILAARQHGWPLGFDGPVEVRVLFHLPRPKTNKSRWPDVKPDLDKLQRAIGDALTEERLKGRVLSQGLLWEDSRICRWASEKQWSDAVSEPGVTVVVSPLPEEQEEAA